MTWKTAFFFIIQSVVLYVWYSGVRFTKIKTLLLLYETICRVKWHSQEAAANMRASSLLPYVSSVPLSVSCSLTSKERIYFVSFERVSFIELLATINLYYYLSF